MSQAYENFAKSLGTISQYRFSQERLIRAVGVMKTLPDINRLVFYDNVPFGQDRDDHYLTVFFMPKTRNPKLLSAAEVVMEILINVTEQAPSSLSEAFVETVSEFLALAPQLSQSIVSKVSETITRLNERLAYHEEQYRNQVANVQVQKALFEDVLRKTSADRLSKLGFGQSAFDWAMSPKRGNLMKRRFEDMHADVATITAKHARTGGGMTRRRATRRSRTRPRQRSRSRRKSQSRATRRY